MRNETCGPRARWCVAWAVAASFAVHACCAVDASPDAADAIPAGPSVPTAPISINAIMVYLADPSAHEIWDRNYAAEPLSDHDWEAVERYANNLAAASALIAIGGTGPNDQSWVESPGWQRLSHGLWEGAFLAMAAAGRRDQERLDRAGDAILEVCEGCHQIFKPDLSTEGIRHIPHGRTAEGG